MQDTGVRTAEPEDLDRLADVEVAADTLFVALGVTGLPPPPPAARRAAAWRVLVTGRPVLGFAVLERVDDGVHLDQLSVHPSAGRRGPGLAALVDAEAAAGLGAHCRRVVMAHPL